MKHLLDANHRQKHTKKYSMPHKTKSIEYCVLESICYVQLCRKLESIQAFLHDDNCHKSLKIGQINKI